MRLQETTATCPKNTSLTSETEYTETGEAAALAWGRNLQNNKACFLGSKNVT